MTDQQKQHIINLRAEGKQYKEIAEELGLSLGCVKVFMSRRKAQGHVMLSRQMITEKEFLLFEKMMYALSFAISSGPRSPTARVARPSLSNWP